MEAESLERELAELARRLAALAEPAMRREVAMEAIFERPAREAVARLRELLYRAPGRGEDLEPLRVAALEVLFVGGPRGALTYELRSDLYAEAAATGDEVLMRLLRTPTAASEMADPGAALHRSLVDVPLGTRRALARGLDKNLLEKLLLDPDELVVEHLLANPRITEPDVVRIAARRPIAASTLRCIARSERFGARPRVRAALARNPYAPSDVGLPALVSLSLRELGEVASDPHLHPDTRAQADFERRRRTGGTLS